MKAICTGYTEGVYTFKFEGETPEVGHKYQLESMHDGTLAQNKLFHALTMEYYNSGQHSYSSGTYDDFRNQIKRSLGVGFDGFVYIDRELHSGADHHYKMFDVKKIEEIPLYIREDEHMKDQIRGKLKSWSNYSKNQRKKTIDNLISEMLQVGINSNKFQEILKGINYGM